MLKFDVHSFWVGTSRTFQAKFGLQKRYCQLKFLTTTITSIKNCFELVFSMRYFWKKASNSTGKSWKKQNKTKQKNKKQNKKQQLKKLKSHLELID